MAANMGIFDHLNRLGFWTIPRSIKLLKGKETLPFLGETFQKDSKYNWTEKERKYCLP